MYIWHLKNFTILDKIFHFEATCNVLTNVKQKSLTLPDWLTVIQGTIDTFLSLVPSTLESYLSAYKDDWPSEDSSESKFVMALCGTVTSKFCMKTNIYQNRNNFVKTLMIYKR